MADSLIWWLALAAVGAAALPITLALFRFLPGRGYAFARPAGLVLVGYAYWLLGSTGLLPNSRLGVVLCLMALIAVSMVVARRRRLALRAFVRESRGHVLAVEVAFLVVFAVWGLIRSHTAGIAHTEQPMDFAFLNGVLQSPRFPPQDPWSAGQGISYYYGGYLLAAYLTKLSGVVPGVAYNLSLMSTAAMAGAAVLGLVYALVRRAGGGVRAATAAGAVGAALLLFAGNVEGVLEFVRANGWGSQDVYRWLSIDGLTHVAQPAAWYPTDTWFWWRSSRVINTFVDGHGIDYTITEYPFFGFLLGDMHPHVMSLPFLVTGLGLALNTVMRRRPWDVRFLAASPWEALAMAMLIGSLGFINSWDLPTMLAVLLGAVLAGVWRAQARGVRASRGQALLGWLAIAAAAVVLFLPFYAGLSSQANGILPVRRVMTRPVHYAIVLGPVLALGLSLLGGLAFRRVPPTRLKKETPAAPGTLLREPIGPQFPGSPGQDGAPAAVAVPTLEARIPPRARPHRAYLWVLVPLAPFALWTLAELGMAAAGSQRLLPPGEEGSMQASVLSVWARLWHLLPLMALLAVALAGMERLARTPGGAVAAFCLLLLGTAFLLALGAELFHVADFFGNRMNTVFKFYYQQWVLLAVAGTFGLWYWWDRARRSGALGVRAVLATLVGVVLVCLPFAVAAAWEKTGRFAGEATLDGLAYVREQDPGEYAAVQWLLANARQGERLIEAVPENMGQPSGDYDAAAARISGRTGIPTLLGWPGHEHQWRGNPYDPIRKRFDDVKVVYATGDPAAVRAILDQYQVTYIVVGGLERRTYGADVGLRFAAIANPVFTSESVTLLRVQRSSGGSGE